MNYTACYIPNNIKHGNFIQETGASQLDSAITAVCAELQSFCSPYTAVAAHQQTPFLGAIHPSLRSILRTRSQPSYFFSGHDHMPQGLLLLHETSPMFTFTTHATHLIYLLCPNHRKTEIYEVLLSSVQHELDHRL